MRETETGGAGKTGPILTTTATTPDELDALADRLETAFRVYAAARDAYAAGGYRRGASALVAAEREWDRAGRAFQIAEEAAAA